MNKKVERMITIGVIAAPLVALFFEQVAHSVTNEQAYKEGFSASAGDGTGAIYALDDPWPGLSKPSLC
jgi:hypothetical protein